jgi:hypothetical protein
MPTDAMTKKMRVVIAFSPNPASEPHLSGALSRWRRRPLRRPLHVELAPGELDAAFIPGELQAFGETNVEGQFRIHGHLIRRMS